MTRHNIINLYLALSVINGIVPVSVALLFSVPGWGGLFVWTSTALITFGLICLFCLRSAFEQIAYDTQQN